MSGALYVIFSLIGGLEALNSQSLNGQWNFNDVDSTYKDLVGNVPGGIYTDLIHNKIIGDVFYGYNDTDTKWVPRKEWIYSRSFNATQDLLKHNNINLIFDGLDTFADVYLNGNKVGESKNMFVQYIFDVRPYLKVGANEIKVHFKSPIKVSADLAAEQAKSYVVPPTCPPNEYHGECNANMIRKMQASYAWDWGPAFPSVGIWKNVAIEAFNSTLIRQVVADVGKDEPNNRWLVRVYIYFAANKHEKVVNGKVVCSMKVDSMTVKTVFDISENASSINGIVVNTSLVVLEGYVNLWWPNGYGAHDLYPLTVTFASTDEREVSSKSVRIGFRTIELVQEPIGSGLSYYFRVNNKPIFMKGSNEIPLNILPEQGQDRALIRRVLSDARDCHMNMLRVWGGGVYESDYFYDLADEMGILIWQDFMFACALYPTNEDFLKNVLEEVDYQVKRLSTHPSIALFAGNNENEAALRDDWYHVKQNFSLFKNDYVKLYIDTIKTKFEEVTHGRRIFLSSSPSDGKQTEVEGYVAENPSNPLFGDVHYYNYLLDPLNSNLYPLPRFASEYGYQSLPSLESWLTVTDNVSDVFINSKFMEHRQHHPFGNGEMLAMMNREFSLPKKTDDKYIEAVIYFSQVIQAMGTRIETERYRLHRSVVDEKGQGHTMGALYWQLNDVWVGPSWSGIDALGKWKIMQYHVKEFMSPLIITGYIDIVNKLQVYVVSDLPSPSDGLEAIIQIFSWDSLEPVSKETLNIELEAGSSKLVTSVETYSVLNNTKCGSEKESTTKCFVYLSLHKNGVKVAYDNYLFPSKIRDSNVQASNVKVTAVKKLSESGSYSIELETEKPALFVWLDTHNIPGRFSENGFVQVTKTRTVFFTSEKQTSLIELTKYLTVRSVTDYSA